MCGDCTSVSDAMCQKSSGTWRGAELFKVHVTASRCHFRTVSVACVQSPDFKRPDISKGIENMARYLYISLNHIHQAEHISKHRKCCMDYWITVFTISISNLKYLMTALCPKRVLCCTVVSKNMHVQYTVSAILRRRCATWR